MITVEPILNLPEQYGTGCQALTPFPEVSTPVQQMQDSSLSRSFWTGSQ